MKKKNIVFIDKFIWNIMQKIIFLYHQDLYLEKVILNVKKLESILDVALINKIYIEHACDKSCACATCHCIVREGFYSLEHIQDIENDMLDKAWGLEKKSRLSCQLYILDENLVVEIPRYTIHSMLEY